MKLSDLHSSRIETIIRNVLREHRREHLCWCDSCDHETACDEGHLEADERVYDINCRDVAKEIMLKLKKLEVELIPA